MDDPYFTGEKTGVWGVTTIGKARQLKLQGPQSKHS